MYSVYIQSLFSISDLSMKYKKFKTLSARVSTNDHRKSEDEEPFHKPECPKNPVHYSHINISTSTSSNSQTSHHSTNFDDSGDSEEEEPIIEPTPTSFMPLQDTPLLIQTSIATTLGLVSYSFQDFGQKASWAKPLAGEEIDADEEDSFGCNKDGLQNVSMAKVLPFLSSLQCQQLAEWHPELTLYVQEMLWLEGQGQFSTRTQCCCGCNFVVDNPHRCCDCYTLELYCEDCMVDRHAYMPFHRLEVSTFHFSRDIQLLMTLCHSNGMANSLSAALSRIVG